MKFEEALAEMRKGRVAVRIEANELKFRLASGALEAFRDGEWHESTNTAPWLLKADWTLEPELPKLPRRFRAKYRGQPCVGAYHEGPGPGYCVMSAGGEYVGWQRESALTDLEWIDPE